MSAAHLVVEIAAKEPLGNRRVAVDLGETQAITAIFDDGATLMYSGRLIKSIRRYWNKVRAKVKQRAAENKRKSRRFRQIERKESRQVEHLLHILTADFVHRCWLAGVEIIAVGDLTGIRERIDYTAALNQRLHAWPFRKIVSMVTYKAGLHGIRVIEVSERYTSHPAMPAAKARSPTASTGGYTLVPAAGVSKPMRTAPQTSSRMSSRYLPSSSGVVAVWRGPWSCRSVSDGMRSTKPRRRWLLPPEMPLEYITGGHNRHRDFLLGQNLREERRSGSAKSTVRFA